jgi:hypothetical protein
MDSVYSPLTENDEETPSPTTEVKVESWSDFRKEMEEQAGISRDSLTIEEATEERVRHRQEQPTHENASGRPLVKLKSRGGPQNLREASQDLSFTRGLQMREELLRAGHTEHELAALSTEKLEAAARGDPLDPPPDKVELTDKWGNPEDGPLSADEAANKLSLWREEQAQQRAEELAQLTGELEARQQQPEPEQQPEQPPQQAQPQQPTEQQQLAQERWRIANLKRMEGHEVAARIDYDQLVAAVVQEFPSLRNGLPTPEQVEDLRQKDPARFQKLANYDAALRDRQQRIAAMAQQRGVHEQQQAQVNAQARAAARQAEDAAFEEKAARHIPNWEQVQGEVRTQARKTLQAAGLSENEIHHLWNGHDALDAHSSTLQLILAKAAQWDLAQAKSKLIRQSNLPSVIKPGVGNFSRGSADNVAELRARMRSAKGNDGIKLGVALLKAQRNRD